VAAFDTASALPVERVREGLNHYLPDAIVVREAYDVEERFDPRRQAAARTYRYTFLESRVRSPLRGRFVHTIGRTLDVAAMGEAGALLAGTRDFAPFCGQRPQGGATVRNVSHATVSRQGGDEVWLEVEANAFLHQQMRRIAGAVQEVGLGRMTIAAFAALVESGVHGAARLVLPARGLCLRKVEYKGFPPLEAGAKTGIGEVAVN
jgi:tRNA pseudouridine38-40 synthase